MVMASAHRHLVWSSIPACPLFTLTHPRSTCIYPQPPPSTSIIHIPLPTTLPPPTQPSTAIVPLPSTPKDAGARQSAPQHKCRTPARPRCYYSRGCSYIARSRLGRRSVGIADNDVAPHREWCSSHQCAWSLGSARVTTRGCDMGWVGGRVVGV